MEKVTRDIITDLYPLYLSGEASADSRQLIEEFLESDPEFARLLGEGESTSFAVNAPDLAPDHELKTFSKIKRHLRGPAWALLLAMICSSVAFGRIVSDTSFDVSPRKFIITASIAACFWVVFFVRLYRGYRSVVFRPR